uniref:Protein kinase domain-containing protein n=1 Tax=Leersia perrieri TaxID=77586 RepID=A0A0D9VAL4_9ORYZ
MVTEGEKGRELGRRRRRLQAPRSRRLVHWGFAGSLDRRLRVPLHESVSALCVCTELLVLSHMDKSDLNKGGNKDETVLPVQITRVDVKEVKNSGYMARLTLKKPSNMPPSSPSLDPRIIGLDVGNPDDNHYIMVMQNINHKNILHMEAVKPLIIGEAKTPTLAVFVEPYTAHLAALLHTMKLGGKYNVLPSADLADIVRQIVEGWEELRVNGMYHGDMCLQNLYYCRTNETIVVKLAGFKSKGSVSTEAALLKDLNGIGRILKSISSLVKENTPGQEPRCILIDNLAMNLEHFVDFAQLGTIKDKILDHVFFWFLERRRKFFTYEIPKALEDDAFCDKVRHRLRYDRVPWDTKQHHGLVLSMNKYRRKKRNLPAYVGTDAIHNVHFVSGAYTHEEEILCDLSFNGMPSTVDDAVLYDQPTLCLDLYECIM